MSPEQAQGQRIDARSDIYALGIVVFELFTGCVPFQGSTPVATLFKHIQEAPPLTGPAAAKLPAAVVPILQQALAKSPEQRQASAAEVAEALKAAREQEFPGQRVTPVVGMTPARAHTPVPLARTPTPQGQTPPAPPQAPAPGQWSTEFNSSGLAPASVARTPEEDTPTVRSPTPDLDASRARSAKEGRPRPRLPTRQPKVTPTTHAPSRAVPIAIGLAATGLVVAVVVAAVWHARRPVDSAVAAATPVSRPAPAFAADQLLASAPPPVSITKAPTTAASSIPPGPASTSPASPTPTAVPMSLPTPAATAQTPTASRVRPSATLKLAPEPTASPTPTPATMPAPAPTPPAASLTQAKPAPAASPGGLPLAGKPANDNPGAAVTDAGELRIGVKPYAEVTIDGQSHGPTPMKPVRLSPGVHTVRLVHPDYQPLQRRVTIRPGERARLTVDLSLDGIPK